MQATWETVAAADPDVLLVSCCGFDYTRNVADAQRVLATHPVASRLRAVRSSAVYAADGNRYLARPGPQLVAGAAAVAVAAAAARGDDAALRALEETGLLPGEGKMWGHVVIEPQPRKAASERRSDEGSSAAASEAIARVQGASSGGALAHAGVVASVNTGSGDSSDTCQANADMEDGASSRLLDVRTC